MAIRNDSRSRQDDVQGQLHGYIQALDAGRQREADGRRHAKSHVRRLHKLRFSKKEIRKKLFIYCFLKTNKNYEEVASLENLYGIVENHLGEYNNMHKAKMNLVIFR